MDDLISRQAAISAICNACGKIDCDKMDKCEKLQLPPTNNSEIPNSSDCISRQAAIDAIHNLYAIHGSGGLWIDQKDAFKALNSLPPAQPEIIRCKDCKYRGVGDYCVYGTRLAWVTKSNDFCSKAERRTDEA